MYNFLFLDILCEIYLTDFLRGRENDAIFKFKLVKLKRKKSESLSVVSNSLGPHGLYSTWNSPGQNTGVGSLSLLQGNFPTQGSNPGLPHWRWILYQLRHKESPRILEQVAYPFSSRSSQPRKREFITEHTEKERRKEKRFDGKFKVDVLWKMMRTIV